MDRFFQDKKVRVHFDSKAGEWLFSAVDVCGVLTDQYSQRSASNYWAKLKERLKYSETELLTTCQQLKMTAFDKKSRKTDVFPTRSILQLVQFIPSKKAKPFKLWLAEVTNDRIVEIYDPKEAVQRSLTFYRDKGYSRDWINQRANTKNPISTKEKVLLSAVEDLLKARENNEEGKE